MKCTLSQIITAGRTVGRLITVALCIGQATSAQGLSKQDLLQGVAYFERTREAVVNATAGLSAFQWNFKPTPDRWSIAEIVEHLALSEAFLLGHVTERVMKAPSGKGTRDYHATDRMILAVIPDRSNKAVAADAVVPKHQWSPKVALSRFLRSREHTVEFLESAANLRDHVTDGPIGQPMDAYQWLLFVAAHSERHIKQLQEVKADPGFPRR